MNVIFDSNILIDHLRDLSEATYELNRYDPEEKSISLITWIEVMAGAVPSTDSITRNLLDEFTLLSITDEVAERSAIIRREHRMKLPDAIIWATAQAHGRMLVTRNTRDYPTDSTLVRVPYVL